MNALYMQVDYSAMYFIQDSKRTIKMLGTNTDMGCDAVKDH